MEEAELSLEVMGKEITEIRDLLREFMESYIKEGNLGADFARLTPKERVGNMVKLLPYFTMKPTEKNQENDPAIEKGPKVIIPSLFPEIEDCVSGRERNGMDKTNRGGVPLLN